MPGHVKQFEGIKWYNKGRLEFDPGWEEDPTEEEGIIGTIYSQEFTNFLIKNAVYSEYVNLFNDKYNTKTIDDINEQIKLLFKKGHNRHTLIGMLPINIYTGNKLNKWIEIHQLWVHLPKWGTIKEENKKND